MKARPLAVIALILASSSVQAQTGSDFTISPKTDLDTTALMAVPMEMMTVMMVLPLKMMQEMMAVPLKMMAAPKDNMYAATMMNPMTLPQQTSQANSGVPTYDTRPAPAQTEPTAQAAPAP